MPLGKVNLNALSHPQQTAWLHVEPSSVELQGERASAQSRAPPLTIARPPHPPGEAFPDNQHSPRVGKTQEASWEPSVPKTTGTQKLLPRGPHAEMSSATPQM